MIVGAFAVGGVELVTTVLDTVLVSAYKFFLEKPNAKTNEIKTIEHSHINQSCFINISIFYVLDVILS